MKCDVLRTYKCSAPEQVAVINAVVHAIEGHRLFQHRFFAQYGKGTLDLATEVGWLKQRHFLSKAFPKLYANVISRSEDLEFLLPFARQLYEEFGNGSPAKIHYKQLKDVLAVAGVSEIELQRTALGASTEGLIKTYNRWTSHEDVLVSAAIFGLAIEPIIAMDMELSLVGLRRSGRFTEPELTYFIDHSHHDYGHSWEILHVTLPKVTVSEQLPQILLGVQELLDARATFYDQFA